MNTWKGGPKAEPWPPTKETGIWRGVDDAGKVLMFAEGVISPEHSDSADWPKRNSGGIASNEFGMAVLEGNGNRFDVMVSDMEFKSELDTDEPRKAVERELIKVELDCANNDAFDLGIVTSLNASDWSWRTRCECCKVSMSFDSETRPIADPKRMPGCVLRGEDAEIDIDDVTLCIDDDHRPEGAWAPNSGAFEWFIPSVSELLYGKLVGSVSLHSGNKSRHEVVFYNKKQQWEFIFIRYLWKNVIFY